MRFIGKRKEEVKGESRSFTQARRERFSKPKFYNVYGSGLTFK
jgi:hypothetical protein